MILGLTSKSIPESIRKDGPANRFRRFIEAPVFKNRRGNRCLGIALRSDDSNLRSEIASSKPSMGTRASPDRIGQPRGISGNYTKERFGSRYETDRSKGFDHRAPLFYDIDIIDGIVDILHPPSPSDERVGSNGSFRKKPLRFLQSLDHAPALRRNPEENKEKIDTPIDSFAMILGDRRTRRSPSEGSPAARSRIRFLRIDIVDAIADFEQRP